MSGSPYSFFSRLDNQGRQFDYRDALARNSLKTRFLESLSELLPISRMQMPSSKALAEPGTANRTERSR